MINGVCFSWQKIVLLTLRITVVPPRSQLYALIPLADKSSLGHQMVLSQSSIAGPRLFVGLTRYLCPCDGGYRDHRTLHHRPVPLNRSRSNRCYFKVGRIWPTQRCSSPSPRPPPSHVDLSPPLPVTSCNPHGLNSRWSPSPFLRLLCPDILSLDHRSSKPSPFSTPIAVSPVCPETASLPTDSMYHL